MDSPDSPELELLDGPMSGHPTDQFQRKLKQYIFFNVGAMTSTGPGHTISGGIKSNTRKKCGFFVMSTYII